MDPVSLGLMGTLGAGAGGASGIGGLATALSVGAGLVGTAQQVGAQWAQASHMRQAAEVEAANADMRAKEATALGQQKAGARMREARLAQSRLKASAGASGSSSSDPTVMSLWEGIEAEGQHNADQEIAAANSQASGIKYQSDLNSWSADANARIKNAGAMSTLIGGIGDAAGSYSRMRTRYGGYQGGSTLAYPGSTGGGWKTTVRYG